MKKKVNDLYESWKTKGYKDINNNVKLRKESEEFVSKHGHDETAKAIDVKKEKASKEDAILGLEIKYLGWLRGLW